MRPTCASLVALALTVPLPAAAADAYPTADRVEFVLECLRNNGGRHDYVYKCSCVIDAIAKAMPYEDYVEAAAVSRYRSMGGERMGVFRDPEPVKAMTKRYQGILTAAKTECEVTR